MSEAPAIVIRQMQPQDAASVAVLTTQLGYPSSEEQIGRRYDLINNRQDACLFVARNRSLVVGWIHVQALNLLEEDARAEIWGLVVAEAARGTGVGRLLVEAAEKWALMRGLDVMCVRSNILREKARAFYEHLGYKVTKTQNAFKKSLR